MEGWCAPALLRRDHGLSARDGDLGTDGVGVVTAISEQGMDPVSDHAEQRAKALHIMRLSRRQHEAERTAFRIASGMELGGEAAARSAKRLGLLSPLFMPTAQWCARTIVLSIMSAVRSPPAISAKVSSIASNTPVSTQRR